MTATKKLKEPVCKATGCDNRFIQYNSFDKWCSGPCKARDLLKVFEADVKKKKLAKKRERIADKKAFRAKDRPHQVKLTQAVVNRYVVYVQEAHKPCYTCGKKFNSNKRGGVIDCGHWLTRGSRPDRARDTRQMRRQCVPCNRYHSGRQKIFEQNLRAELGDDVVDEIRGPSDGDKVTAQDLIEIRAHYSRLIREAGQ